MRFIITAALLPCIVFAQMATFGGKTFTTDDKIALYEQWVKADTANLSNQTLLAAAYIQKTRETTDFSYLDRASRIVDRVLVLSVIRKRSFLSLSPA